jgi:asparagine synthase (glutamine-hydrolysing)
MCGICGILNYQSKERIGQEELERMSQTISYRGPDDNGYYLDNQIGLAHRRLSIIDLAGGRQPIFNEDKSIVLVFNGEIYNYQELSVSLIAKGHNFSTHTDAEVIIHLYEELKEECVRELRGMFAFALWDKRAEKLILVRDRVGIKPLFYAFDGTRLVFASEIKGILSTFGFSKKINYAALHDFLSFMTTTGEKTIFEGIYRLLPAQMLTFSAGKLQKKNYWEPFAASRIKGRPEDFLRLLKETIKCHLISDVPVGAFLSGGLDSSIIVALMSKFMPGGFKTFSIGFPQDKYYNELPYAKMVAERFNTKHYEYIVNPDIAQLLPKMIRFFDEPFAVSSALPTYLLT